MSFDSEIITLTGDQLAHCLASFARECFREATVRAFTARYQPSADGLSSNRINPRYTLAAILRLARTQGRERRELGDSEPATIQFAIWQQIWDLRLEVASSSLYGISLKWWPVLQYRLDQGKWPICLNRPAKEVREAMLQKTREIIRCENQDSTPDVSRWLQHYFEDKVLQ